MPSVGALAAIVNIIVLLAVALVDRVIELVVRNFAAARLRKAKRAPVVHDSDTWLPNIPRSVIKYHKHPAILLTVICAVFLISSEIVTELGVDVSNMCSPTKKSGLVITPGNSSDSFTEVELGASAFFVQTVNFLDDVTRVPSGLPRSIKGSECMVCMKPEVYPEILAGCTIKDYKVYGPGELNVSILTTDGPFKTITSSMTEIGGSGKLFEGRGDLTFNGNHYSAFTFVMDSEKGLIYLEYSSQVHLRELTDKARAKKTVPAREPIDSRVIAKRISCSTNVLSANIFMDAVSIYRTIQLENTINPASFVSEQGTFQNLTADDVYRAALSVKIIDDDLGQGEYYEYTTCGKYKWTFMIPILVCIAIILFLFSMSLLVATGFDAKKIPYNSRSWFRHYQTGERGTGKYKGMLAKERSGYFGSMFDEMVVLEEGRSESVRIGLRTRDGTISPLGTPAVSGQIYPFVSDYHKDLEFARELGSPANVVLTSEVEVPAQPDDGEDSIP